MKNIYPTVLHRKDEENNSFLMLFFSLPLAPLGEPHFLFPLAQFPGDIIHILHMCRTIFAHPLTSYSGTVKSPTKKEQLLPPAFTEEIYSISSYRAP